jgi:uncharacterized protein DUF5995
MTEAVDALVARMEELLASMDAAGDPARFFLGTYLRTTRAVGAAIDAGIFEDPQWVSDWDVDFAELYLDALVAYRRDPAAAPEPWRQAFGTRADARPEAHVLLGMNAHINYDLPIAVADALDRDELAVFGGDFDRMNDLLASLVDEVSADIALCWPLLRWINRLGRGPDDVIVDFSMRYAREHAWCSALKLAPLAGAERRRAIAVLDAEAVRLARDVARPSAPGRIVAAIIRAGERGSVPDIIDDLLH